MITLIILPENKTTKYLSLLPTDIALLVKKFNVYIPINYGKALSVTNEEYQFVGAKIYIKLSTIVKCNNDIIYIKLSQLKHSELKLISTKSIVISEPYFANNPKYLSTILKKKLTIYAMELSTNTFKKDLAKINGSHIVHTLLTGNSLLFNKNAIGISSANQCNYIVFGFSDIAIECIIGLLKNEQNVFFVGQSKEEIESINTNHDIKSVSSTSNGKLECSLHKFDEMYALCKKSNGIVSSTNNFETPSKIKITYDSLVQMPNGSIFIDCCTKNGYSSDVIMKKNTINKPFYNVKNITVINFDDFSNLYPLSTSQMYSKNIAKLLVEQDSCSDILSLLSNKEFSKCIVTTIKDNIGIVTNPKLLNFISNAKK